MSLCVPSVVSESLCQSLIRTSRVNVVLEQLIEPKFVASGKMGGELLAPDFAPTVI